MAILDVQHIEKHFGATRVLEDISFSLEEGQALSIIGSSGSGKTTLLRCLNFLETPTGGQILVNGQTIFDAATNSQLTDAQLAAAGIGADLIRLSVGIENVEDIIADLEQALAQV